MDPAKISTMNTSSPSKSVQPAITIDTIPDVNELITTSGNEISFSLYRLSERGSKWMVDSGCTQHCTNNKNDFIEYHDLSTPGKASLAGKGVVINIVGHGTVVTRHINSAGQEVLLTLRDVYYIPDSSGRYFAPGIALKKGYQYHCTLSEFQILDRSGGLYLSAYPDSHSTPLYWLDAEIIKPASKGKQPEEKSVLANSMTNWELWHRRMGHPEGRVIQNLPHNVDGIPSQLSRPHDVSPCDGCAFGKQKRLPFPPSKSRASKVLELVHSDLDEMPNLSIDGYKWTCIFLDDYSSCGIMYYLKQKDHALTAFQQFKAWAEKQLDASIKILRMDRGGEYIGNRFKNYLKEVGIEFNYSMPRSPQQNGRAERWQQTIVNKAESMRHFAGLSSGFWKLAVETAVHVYNRTPLKRAKWKTPIELWMKKKPDVSYFRIFGCKAFVYVHKDKRSKLEPKAKIMIFVGYEPGSKGYRFWDPSSRTIILSRDVQFDESSFPNRNQPAPGPPPVYPSPELELVPPPGSTVYTPPVMNPPPVPDVPDPPENVATAPAAPPPSPPPHRPRRANAGKNPLRTKDSVYGDRTPAEVLGDTSKGGAYRERTQTQSLEFTISQLLLHAFQDTPQSYTQAVNSPEKDEWMNAMQEEYDGLLERGTWELVDRPKGRKVIKNRWTFVRKLDGRYKARLVAKGFTQVYGVDYNETFSPVARFESLRFLLAHAALEDWEIEGMDVKLAFLHSDLDEEIYMEQPEGFIVEGQEDKVVRLKKAIYGLKQASRAWFKTFSTTLKENDFNQIYSDAGVYVYHRRKGETEVIIIVYVDDLLIMGPDIHQIQGVKDFLKKAYHMKDLGPASSYLGFRLHRDRTKKVITLDQESYVLSALKRFGMENVKSVRQPLPPGIDLVTNTSQCSPNFRTEYQQLIGTLLYIALGSRPDIGYAVTKLSQFSSNPSNVHLHGAKHVLRYLAHTASYKITYQGGSNAGLIGYSDSDWAQDREDRHSVTGYVFFMAGGPLTWNSRRQDTVALSSTEAEYMALTESSRQCAWMRTFQREIGFQPNHPTPICSDNMGSIHLASNPVQERRSKHIDTRHHFVREFVAKGSATLFWIEGKQQVADILTKNLAGNQPQFERCLESLGLL